MNIFFLYFSAVLSARALGDKHVVKMPLEMAQLLCTAYRWLYGQRPASKKNETNKKRRLELPHENEIYKMTHHNHPMAIWVRSSKENFEWTLQHGIALCEEWNWRYDHPINKEHKCMRIFRLMQKVLKQGEMIGKFPETGLTVPPQCVGPVEDGYHVDGNTFAATVRAYRAYYVGAKANIAKYEKKPMRKPNWFILGVMRTK